MRFSLDWLKRHLETNKTVREIAQKLTEIGIEVEEFCDAEEIFKNFVIASVSDVQKHPNAERLRTCTATLADGSTRAIVCGAKNLKDGLKVVLALPGAVIPATGNILKKSKIRGVPSEGMLCSLEELGMAAESDGIIELPEDTPLDASVCEVMAYSSVFDVSVTPNRGDCFCVRGIARDLAAAGIGTLKQLDDVTLNESFECSTNISIENDEVHTTSPFLSFRVIRDVQKVQSPEWVYSLLKSANIKPISAVIDFANFVMLDIGQPLHVYDLDKLANGFNIRYAKHGETFVDLQGRIHKLTNDTLISADENGPLCLLGIVGGERCACDENTKNILIEAACFDSVYTSTTGRKYNVVSDARTRFERGVDPRACCKALDRFANLVVNHCGGSVSKSLQIGVLPVLDKLVSISSHRLNSILGYHVQFDTAIDILKSLGFCLVELSKELAKFKVPSHRFDIQIEEDLIEEVVRIIGYDNIQMVELKIRKTNQMTDELCKLSKITSLKRCACACGLSELRSFSFIDQSIANVFASELVPSSQNIISISNPISTDLGVMRNSLYPSLISNAAKSLRFSERNCNLFEIGHVFAKPNEQKTMLAAVRIGNVSERSWLNKDRSADVFDIKSDMMACLMHLGIDESRIGFNMYPVPEYYHPTRSAGIYYRNHVVGFFGEIKPSIAAMFDIDTTVACFEVFIDEFLAVSKKEKTLDLSQKIYQPVERDFSFVFKEDRDHRIHAVDVVNAIRKVSDLIKSIAVFDYYKIDEYEFALGINIKLQAMDKTLTDAEIKDVSSKIVDTVHKLGGGMR